VDRKNFGPHRKWCAVLLVGTCGAVGWYSAASVGASSWPSGASAPGLTFGIVAGLLILFEFLLWPRKAWFRAWRIGRTQSWLRAHIWLGLLTVPLVVLHAWREAGGALTVTLLVLFGVVIVSGIWGLAMQQFVPRAMLAEVSDETIYTQIDTVVGGYQREARQLVTTAGGSSPAGSPGSGHLLEQAFSSVIEPYLSPEDGRQSALASPREAEGFFRNLRDRVEPSLHPAIDRLERWCDQRRQLARQARLHFWLHNWLWIHLPLSAALVVLLAIHVVVALKFL
jgi:hypothetical protein